MSCFGLDPDGVSAVANSVMATAAVVSLVAVFVAYRAWRSDADDRRRAQAVKVSAVVGESGWSAVVIFDNASAEPVYDVVIEYVSEEGERRPGAEFRAVPPGGKRKMGVAREVVAAAVVFTDAAGVRWRRSENGRLVQE